MFSALFCAWNRNHHLNAASSPSATTWLFLNLLLPLIPFVRTICIPLRPVPPCPLFFPIFIKVNVFLTYQFLDGVPHVCSDSSPFTKYWNITTCSLQIKHNIMPRMFPLKYQQCADLLDRSGNASCSIKTHQPIQHQLGGTNTTKSQSVFASKAPHIWESKEIQTAMVLGKSTKILILDTWKLERDANVWVVFLQNKLKNHRLS